MKRLAEIVLPILMALGLLSGCGGGGGSAESPSGGTTNLTGRFIDAAVSGLNYRCGSATTTSGTTTADGSYTCPSGQSVSFYVGDIKVGTIPGVQAIATPLDLVGTANVTTSDTHVTNITRFLMSISNTDPALGTITIPASVHTAAAGQAIDFATVLDATLNSTITSIAPTGSTLYTAAQAQQHLNSNLNGMFSGDYAGNYSGTGGASGSWQLTINSTGNVTGTYTSSNGGGTVTGTMSPSLSTGGYAFAGTSSGSSIWSGTLNLSTGEFSGTWHTSDNTETGSYTGNKAAPAASATPTVASFTPASGAVGDTVTITGTNFSTTATNNSVSFNGVPATVTSATATLLVVTVPATATTGNVTVTVGGQTATSASGFTVTGGGGTQMAGGLWRGTNPNNGNIVDLMVSANGAAWIISNDSYMERPSSVTTGTILNNAGALSGTATYVALDVGVPTTGLSVTGTQTSSAVTLTVGVNTLSLTPVATTPATLAAVTRSWGNSWNCPVNSDYISTTIAANGQFAVSTMLGKTFNGQLTPSAAGDYFDATLTFGGTSTMYANKTFTGIAYLTTTATNMPKLVVVASDGTDYIGFNVQ